MIGLLISRNLSKLFSFIYLSLKRIFMGKHCKNCTCPKPKNKEFPCEYCGKLCVRTFKRALCSLECRLLGNILLKNGCMIWKGKISVDGYGVIMVNKKRQRAHRVSHELFNGPIPYGLLIRHICAVKRCINPAHLISGTVQNNSDDFLEGNPIALKGENSPNARLKESDIKDIRNLYLEGNTQTEIARRFGISQNMVSHIILRKSWSHV